MGISQNLCHTNSWVWGKHVMGYVSRRSVDLVLVLVLVLELVLVLVLEQCGARPR